MNYIPYLIQTQICFTVLWLVYRVFIQRGSTLSHCRIYLLSMVGVAFIIPALSIPVYAATEHVMVESVQSAEDLAVIYNEPYVAYDVDVNASIHSTQDVMIWIYFAGVAAMLAISLNQLYRLWVTLNREKKSRITGYLIFTDKIDSAFSFFNYILINRENIGEEGVPQVVAHEMAHVRLCHSMDMIFCRILQILLWWNPVVWLWVRSLKEVHEYQADAYVLNSGFDSKQYISLIIQNLADINPDFVSGFSYSLIKKRLFMISQQQNKRAKWHILIALPVMVALLPLFSFTEKEPQKPKETTKVENKSSDAVIIVNGKQVDQAAAETLNPKNVSTIKVVRGKTFAKDTISIDYVEVGDDKVAIERLNAANALTKEQMDAVKKELANIKGKISEVQLAEIEKIVDANAVVVKRAKHDAIARGTAYETLTQEQLELVKKEIAKVKGLKEEQIKGLQRTIATANEMKLKGEMVQANAARVNVRGVGANTEGSAVQIVARGTDTLDVVGMLNMNDNNAVTTVIFLNGKQIKASEVENIGNGDIYNIYVNKRDGAKKVYITTKEYKLSQASDIVMMDNDAVVIVDGKQINKSELKNINADNISKITVNRTKSINVETKNSPVYTEDMPKSVREASYQTSDGEKIYTVSDIKPKFQNGDVNYFKAWVLKKFKYTPTTTKKADDKIVVEFIIEKDGSVSNQKIVSSTDKTLNDQILNILKSSPKWTPAKQGGQPVKFKVTLPVIIRQPVINEKMGG